MQDSDLISRVRAGDGSAWETLVEQHQTAVFRLACLMLGDADEAQDVAQDVFTRVFRHLERYDATQPLRPWILGIAANQARNYWRRGRRYWAALGRWYQSRDDQQDAPDVEGDAWQRSEAETLWQAIRRLRIADQQVIYLRYFLELPTDEVAAALGIAPGTVKSRLHRALGRLRAVIERDFGFLAEEHVP